MPAAPSTVVRPPDPELFPAIRLALVFAALKFALHLAANLWEAHLGYGYFRDEMYYILCGRHLAWGYVDHGPVVAVQANLAIALFGKSLAGIRMLSAAGGAARVFLTGVLAWSLGGRRSAQGLAMLCVIVAPQYLGIDSYLSMNSMESIFWMTCLLAMIVMVRGSSQSMWLLFGCSAGIGLLNKPSMTFFLIALLVALLLSPQRHLLYSKWAVLGVTLMVVTVLPNLLWQVHNHWPTLEFLHNGQVENKNIKLAPIPFLITQIVNLQPATLLVWGAGLVWLLRSPEAKCWRWLAVLYLIFLTLMMALHAKDYYVMPIYPVLFAAGGIAWERRFARRSSVVAGRTFAFPLFESLVLVAAVVLLPLSMPVLRPQTWIVYTRAMHLDKLNGNTENEASSVLPQFYADRFGWQEEVDEVTHVYQALSPQDRARVGIYCSNYGEASAINFLGEGLPSAISGHNSYYLWGSQGLGGDIMIVINGATPEEMHTFYDSVAIVGRMDHPYAMPYEHRNIYLVRGRKLNLTQSWESLKHYI